MNKQWVIIGLMAISMGGTLFAEDIGSSNQVALKQEIASSNAVANKQETASSDAVTNKQETASSDAVTNNEEIVSSDAVNKQEIVQEANVAENEEVAPTAAQKVSEDQLDEVSIVPVNYQGKIFTNGEYIDLSYEKYKVYSESNTSYLPLRLLTKVVSTNEEIWEAKWDSKKPNEVILQCNYMTSTELGGWLSSGKTKTIKLTVGSCAAEINTSGTNDDAATKSMQQLSKAPKKINGSICLPLRAIGEILGKQVSYKNGLVFISQNGINLENEEMTGAIQTVKTHLESNRQAVQSDEYVTAVTNYNGINYYAVSHYNEKTGENELTIYSQQGKGTPQVLKKIESAYNTNVQVVDYDFYYLVNGSRGANLERFDLTTMQSHVVWQMAVDENFNFVSRVIPVEDVLYVVVHNGDWTMGSEELYKIVDGKCEKLIGCSQFGSLIIDGNMIYYTEMSNWLNTQNIGCYNQKTKQNGTIGSPSYVYDMKMSLVDDEANGYGICGNAFIRNGKLYTLAYENGSSKKQAVCSIDLKTNVQKQITTPTANYWLNGEHIYYIESATGYIKTVDLEGNGEKTLVSTPVQKADLQNNCLYYTKQGGNKDLGSGLYIYGLGTGTTTTVSDKPIRDFKVSGKRIAYVTSGYAPGIYKWIDGKNTLLEKRLVSIFTLGEGSISYNLIYDKGNFVVTY